MFKHGIGAFDAQFVHGAALMPAGVPLLAVTVPVTFRLRSDSSVLKAGCTETVAGVVPVAERHADMVNELRETAKKAV